MVLPAIFRSHQEWWRNIRARLPGDLRDNLRSDHCPIDTKGPLLDIKTEHFDRIFIFKSNAEFIRQSDLRWVGPRGLETVETRRAALAGAWVCEPAATETGIHPGSIRQRFSRDSQRLVRRGFAEEASMGNQAAKKSQRHCRSEQSFPERKLHRHTIALLIRNVRCKVIFKQSMIFVFTNIFTFTRRNDRWNAPETAGKQEHGWRALPKRRIRYGYKEITDRLQISQKRLARPPPVVFFCAHVFTK